MSKSSSAPELVFAKKGDLASWGWSDPARELGAAWKIAESARVIRAAQAIGCGLVAMIAKDIVGHGQFGGWVKEKCAEIKERTLRNYMAAARAFLKAKEVKPRQLTRANSQLVFWATHPSGLITGDPVFDKLTAYIGERSLFEIYQDEGIVRERDPQQQHTPATQTPEEAVQLEMRGILESLDTAVSNTTTLVSTGNWEKVPVEKRWAFITTQIPALRLFALNTTWTPAQRTAIESALVTITSGLRGKEGK
jgi:hypothetical protein